MSDPIFLDTVGLVAVWNRKDQWHKGAKAAFSEIVTSRAVLVTTSFVLLECGNAAARYPFRTLLTALREELLHGGNLIEPSLSDCEQAWAAYQRSDFGDAGIVDHVSFIVMRRLGLKRVFSNDDHFRAAGFETLF
jgi:predicted nucleic acid-binding protein